MVGHVVNSRAANSPAFVSRGETDEPSGDFIELSSAPARAIARARKNEFHLEYCNIACNIYNLKSATCIGYHRHGCGNSERRRSVEAVVGGGLRATVYAAGVSAASGRVSGRHDTW